MATPTPTPTPTLTLAQNAVEVVSCCRSENLTVLVLGNYSLGQTILIDGECYEILGPYGGPVGPTVYTINADNCAQCLSTNPCATPTPTPTQTVTNTPTPYFYYIENCCDQNDTWRITSLTDLGWNIGEFISLKLISPGGSNPNDGCYTIISQPDSFSSYTWDQTEVTNSYGSCEECFATEITLTLCPTPTPTLTPTISQTATQTVTPTQTSTETPTPTPTPTQTSTPTLTPTISQTSTPTATPTLTATDEPFDIYSFVSCCDPSNKFRYNNVIGILSVGQVFHISGGTGFEGCAEVIPYEVTGPIYVGSEVNFIEQGNCEGDLCEECPTPTPTPTLQSCECISYVITNLFDIPDFVYFTNCFGDTESVEVQANSEISICACEGTVFSGDGIGIVQDGFCPPLTQTPQPTLTQQSTPTPTPTIGWNLCDQDFCFVTYEPSLDLYNGTYVVGGTYGDRYFYSGDVEGVVYYNVLNSQWCLSDSVGGECLLGGPSPSLSPCPDLWSEIFVEGTCNTTTTTTSDCETFDFVAYFDCDTSETQTPTPTPTLTPTQTLTPTPSLDICSSVSANIVISAYTTTTTTIPVTTTTTTICYETVTGTTSYEVLNEIFVCPGLTYEFVGCENGTLYYVEPSSLFNNINLVNGTVVSFNSGSETICATFNGTTTVSPNLSIQGPVFDYEGCLLCLIQPTLTPTPTFTPTNTPSNTPSNTPTLTATPTSTSGPTPTPTVTVSQTQTVTPTQTATPTPTLTPTITLTPTTSNNPYPFTLVGKCYDGRFYAEGGSAFSNCTQVQNGLGSSTRYKSNYPTNYLYNGQWQFVNMIIYDSVTMTVLNSLPLSDGCHFWETSSNGKVLAGYPQLGYDCTNQDICCVGFEPE